MTKRRRSQQDPLTPKIERLRNGGRPRVLDLFSGCGGLTVGFQRAGFTPIGGVESDPHAAASYARNFHPGGNEAHFAQARDVRKVDLADLLQVTASEVVNAVDVVIGGPPCPSFTRVGRAKLREVMSHPEAYKLDERTTLYLHALRLIDETKPLAVMIENVPDILNQGGRAVGDEIAGHLVAMGYSAAYTLMNASNYGVPQMRDRFFLMAYANELGVNPTFPAPTHWVQMPSGYKGSRDVALKLLGDLDAHPSYSPPATPGAALLPAVTSTEAIGDLPKIFEPQQRGARRFDRAIPHLAPSITQNSYAATMRNWPRFESTGELWDHVTRSLGPRDLRLFAQMEAGDEYPAAHRLAVKLWRNAGAKPKDLRAFVPPYDPGKFPNKWRKMEPDAPARTLMAHLGKDTYSHIHYDSGQARTITVREAARLQSFPDGFSFAGTMNPAFRQIGNAVPPLLAFHLAGAMMSTLSSANSSLQERSSA